MIAPETLTIDMETDTPEARQQAQQCYERWGCFVARGLLSSSDLEDIRHELQQLIVLMVHRAGLDPQAPSDAPFDAELSRLYEVAPGLAENIFTAARRLTSVHRLSVHPRLLQTSQSLMKSTLVMSSPYKPVRMDNPSRVQMLLPWHQDYPYAQDSSDGVVYWIPLHDVTPRNGCLRIAPGSHTLGILPVVMCLPPKSMSHGIKGLRLADPSVVERFETVEMPMRAGDVLVFSNLLLHRSQENHTKQSRWTVQVRHGNFAHPHALEKLWPRGHYERHWFDETHPELVAGSDVAEE